MYNILQTNDWCIVGKFVVNARVKKQQYFGEIKTKNIEIYDMGGIAPTHTPSGFLQLLCYLYISRFP